MSWATSGLLLLLLVGGASAAPTTCKSGTGTGTTIKAAAAAATVTTDSTASLDSCRIEVTLSGTTYTVKFYGDATNTCSAGASSVTGLVYETCCDTTDCNIFEAYVVKGSVAISRTSIATTDIDDTKFCTGVAAAGTVNADVYNAGACSVDGTTATGGVATVTFTVVTSGQTEAEAFADQMVAADLVTAFDAANLVRDTAWSADPAITIATEPTMTEAAVVDCYSGTAITGKTSYYDAPTVTATVSDRSISCRIKKLKSADATPVYATTVEGSEDACPSAADDATLLYESCCEEDLCNEHKPVKLDGSVEITMTDLTAALANAADATYKTELCTVLAASASEGDDQVDESACTAGTAVAGSATNKVKFPFTILAPNRAAAERMSAALEAATTAGDTGATAFNTALNAAGDDFAAASVTATSYATSDPLPTIVADPLIKCYEGELTDASDLMADVDDEDLEESEAIYSSCRITKLAVTDGDETTYTTTYAGVEDEGCPSETDVAGVVYESCCDTESCNVFEPYLVFGTATLTGTDEAASTFSDDDKEAFCEAVTALASTSEFVAGTACTVEAVEDTPASARKLLAATSIDVTFSIKTPYKAAAEAMEEALVAAADDNDDTAFEDALSDATITTLKLADSGLATKVITDPPIKCYTGELLDSDDKAEKPEDLEAGTLAEWSSCRLVRTRTEQDDDTYTYDTTITGSADLCPEVDPDAEDDPDLLFDLCCEEDLCNKLEDVKVKVQASMTLAGVTAAAFGASHKAKFCAAVAKAAGNGVVAADCVVTAVKDTATRRSLQAGSVDVDFEVLVEDMAVGNAVGAALGDAVTDGSFDDELAAAGLPGLGASGFSYDLVTDTKGLSVPSSPTTPTTPTGSVDIDLSDDDNKKKLALGLGIGLGLGIPVLLAVIIAVVVISRRKQQATSPAPPPGQYP